MFFPLILAFTLLLLMIVMTWYRARQRKKRYLINKVRTKENLEILSKIVEFSSRIDHLQSTIEKYGKEIETKESKGSDDN